jgi:hypothetical protein
LKSQHEKTSEENKQYLLQKFYAYEYEEGGNVTSHITAIETMATDLSDLNLIATGHWKDYHDFATKL